MGDQGNSATPSIEQMLIDNQSTESDDHMAQSTASEPIKRESEIETPADSNPIVSSTIEINHIGADLAPGILETHDDIKVNDPDCMRSDTVLEQDSIKPIIHSIINNVESTNLPKCIPDDISAVDIIESLPMDSKTPDSNTPAPVSPSNPGLATSPGGGNSVTLTPLSDRKPGQKGKTKRRGSAWTDDETDFLMEVWAGHTDGAGTDEFPQNTPVYRLISKAMLEKGFDKSWEQCKTRIHTLKRAYKITEDEIKAGKTNIIQCKHYDSLRIIMGNDPSILPKTLADLLAQKRIEREEAAKTAQNGTPMAVPQTTPSSIKRKHTSSEKSVKRQNSNSSDKSQISPSAFGSLQIAPIQGTNNLNQSASTVTTSTVWIPGLSVQPAQITTNLAVPQQTVYMPPAQFLIPPPPPYQPPAPSYPATQQIIPQQPAHRPQLQEINNNNIPVKVEHIEDQKPQFVAPAPIKDHRPLQTTPKSQKTVNSNGNSVLTPKSSLQQKKEELEKLKLNLEMRKLDMERNKLEMEERQRREERDHQYRMMQLLLFGLGQQSAASVNGHVTEQELGHVPNTITLSRAIENGLVPGGSLQANEKGLSFSEI